MIDSVLDWVLPIWSATVSASYQILGRSPPAKVTKFWDGIAQPLPNKKSIACRIPLDLQGWKYGDMKAAIVRQEVARIQDLKSQMLTSPVTEGMQAMLKTVLAMFDANFEQVENQSIHLQVIHDTSGVGGDWAPNLNQLTIRIDTRVSEEDVRQIVEHELRHVAQTVFAKAADKLHQDLNQSEYGLPSKKIRTPHQQDQTKYDALLHTLDDREFYPMLADHIVKIRKVLQQVRVEDRGAVFSMLVGRPVFAPVSKTYSPLPFFQRLKDHAPGKYTKAVTEARKAIGLRDDWAQMLIK